MQKEHFVSYPAARPDQLLDRVYNVDSVPQHPAPWPQTRTVYDLMMLKKWETWEQPTREKVWDAYPYPGMQLNPANVSL